MQDKYQDQPSIAQRALSGAVLLGVGVIMLGVAWGYPLGRLTQMGPGFIPRVIGLLICALAVVIIIVDIMTPRLPKPEMLDWRGLTFISAAILIFAGLVEVTGLVPSMFLAVAVSMLADREARLLGILAYAVLASLGGWFLFLVALELPIPAFWRVR
jgi:hypothetical protein